MCPSRDHDQAAGDAALLLETGAAVTDGHAGGNGAAAIAAAIRAADLPSVIDVVPGAATVLVTFEPRSWPTAGLTDRLRELAIAAPTVPASAASKPVLIDTVYEGPDVAGVAALTGLAEVRRWWRARGREDYPGASRLLITADAGGSISYRYRVWKSELAALAAKTGLMITVCHFPPGSIAGPCGSARVTPPDASAGVRRHKQGHG